MKNFSIFIILLSSSLFSNSQTFDVCNNAALEMRYWKLRGQLIGDEHNRDIYNGFMTVGSGPGKSLPADVQKPDMLRTNYWEFGKFDNTYLGCAFQFGSQPDANPSINNFPIDVRDNQPMYGIVQWYDNSLITLGYYIAVLSSEWKLLKKSNMNTTQTEKELFYALETIERLDKKAELQYGLPEMFNGFLMRDDVSESFVMQTMGKNFDCAVSHLSCGKPDMIDNPTFSQFTDRCSFPLRFCDQIFGSTIAGVNCDSKYKLRDNVASGDEINGILFGFCFIKRYLNQDVEYNGENLLNKTKNITRIIMQNLKQNKWVINDPELGRPVCKGGLAISVCYGLAKMGEYITDDDFLDDVTSGVGNITWQLAHLGWTLFPTTDVTIVYPTGILPNMNINFKVITFPIGGGHDLNAPLDFNMVNFIRMASVTQIAAYYPFDWSGKHFISNLSNVNHIPIFDLIGSEFTGYKADFDREFWEQELSIGGCNSNCWQIVSGQPTYFNCDNFVDDVNDLTFWHTSNRWEHNGSISDLVKQVENKPNYFKKYPGRTEQDFINDQINGIRRIEQYNGLDYMLAFNLYRLHFFKPSGTFDRIRRNVNGSIPGIGRQSLNNLGGTDNNPLVVKAVFSIDSKTKIFDDGNAHFEAGSDINLKRGFKAEVGSVLKANIIRYDCTPACYNNGMVMGRSLDTLSNEFDYQELDTTLSTLEEDSTLFSLKNEANYIDTNIWVIQLVNDTFFVSLNPLYKFDSLGNIVPNTSPRFMQSSNQGFNIVRVYPNPAADIINVNYFLPSTSNVSITIFNAIGEIVKFEKIDNFVQGVHQHSYNISGFSNGFYNLELNINGVIKNYKFVKVNK
jgi:Secretion system C-terminal sorting domain